MGSVRDARLQGISLKSLSDCAAVSTGRILSVFRKMCDIAQDFMTL